MAEWKVVKEEEEEEEENRQKAVWSEIDLRNLLASCN